MTFSIITGFCCIVMDLKGSVISDGSTGRSGHCPVRLWVLWLWWHGEWGPKRLFFFFFLLFIYKPRPIFSSLLFTVYYSFYFGSWFQQSEDFYGMRRLYVILGSCLFYKVSVVSQWILLHPLNLCAHFICWTMEGFTYGWEDREGRITYFKVIVWPNFKHFHWKNQPRSPEISHLVTKICFTNLLLKLYYI